MERRTHILVRIQILCLIVFCCAGQFSISITQIGAFLGGCLWLFKTHTTRTWARQRWPLWIPFVIFGLANMAAVVTALDPLWSAEHLKRLFEMVIFFWVLNSLSDPDIQESLRSLIDRFKGARGGQELSQKPEKPATLSPLEFFFGCILLASSVAALYGLIQVALKGVSLHHRISGTFSHYMTYAGILMQTALGAAAYLLFRNSKNRWVWAAFLLIITALALTLTRQAWLGFGVGFLILLTIRKPVLAAGFPILVALVFWLSPPAVKERVASLSNLGDATFKERIIMWQVGWEMFQDYPVTGCGFHCLRIVGKDYPGYHELAVPYHTLHNNIVQIAIDAGTLGVLAWLYLWLSYFVAAGRKTASKTGSAPRWPILASIGAITAFMVGGLFETNFYDSEVVMLAYVFMALPFVETPKETGKQN